MQADQLLTFGLYQLDPMTGQLKRGKQEVRLTGKASALLRTLVARAGQVVTKDELFATVWAETVVSDTALTSCIQELRQALRDNAKSPRYIATVHRRGFQFIAPVTAAAALVPSSRFQVQSSKSEPTPDPRPPIPSFVGRETELAQLHHWLEKALHGERQIVFVTGEPGIGKTTLIEAFLQSLASRVRNEEERQQATQAEGLRLKASGPPPFSPSSLQPAAYSLLHSAPSPWIGRGQCIEHHGSGEPYLPVLEALGRLCRESRGDEVIARLRQYAPTWLAQLPAVLHETEREHLHRQALGATRERMLRELAEALEALTAEHALILRLEDLHWSDYSTLDLLSVLARRQEAAQLLIVGTYRPVEVLTRDHPLKGVKQELQLHGQCEELALDFLSEADVAEYLMQRFGPQPPHPVPLQRGERRPITGEPFHTLAHLIHQRTDGNPLFMINVVDSLVACGVLVQNEGRWELQGRGEEVEKAMPESLQQLIEQQIARLRPEVQRLLEVASVAGVEFSAAAVAAGLETEVDGIEEQCGELVRREQFLRASGTAEWPDGTVAARYGFRHALYQDVLYHRLTARRRQRLHQRIGEQTEQAFGKRAREIATELAGHFERGRDYGKAVQYLRHAGENAVRRSAHQEAISLLSKGLALLKTLPDIPEHAKQELTFQITLGSALVVTRGYAAPEVEQAYTRARDLCQQLEETPQLFPVLWGLWDFYLVRAEHKTARELGEQLLTLAQRVQDPVLLLEAHDALGQTLCCLGEFASARAHVEQGIALYDPQQHRSLAFLYGGEDPGVLCLCYAGRVLWALGYADQALQRNHEALSLARELSHPHSLAVALINAAWLHQYRREGQAAQERAEAAIRLSTEQGFPHWVADGASLRGWVLAEQGQEEEGIAQVRWGMAAWQDTGAEAGRPYYLALLAEAYGKVGQGEEGLTVLVEALAAVNKTGERRWEAELYRLKGELTLQQESQKAKVKSQKFQSLNPKASIPTPTPKRKQRRAS